MSHYVIYNHTSQEHQDVLVDREQRLPGLQEYNILLLISLHSTIDPDPAVLSANVLSSLSPGVDPIYRPNV